MRRYFIFSPRRGFSNKNMTWINRHVKDPYVKSATTDNLRSRSAYKLIEINDKFKIISKTIIIIITMVMCLLLISALLQVDGV